MLINLKWQMQRMYLVGLSCELAAAELALDLAFGAVVLQVLGQVAARQLDGTAVGAGDHVEGAGGEVALEKRLIVTKTVIWFLLFNKTFSILKNSHLTMTMLKCQSCYL